MNTPARVDTRVRLGPIAMALLKEEGGEDSMSGDHLEIAITKLQTGSTALIEECKLINRNLIKLGNLIVAEIRADDGDLLEAMKEVVREIGEDVITSTKETEFNDADLPEKRDELDRVMLAQREERAAKERAREAGDRER